MMDGWDVGRRDGVAVGAKTVMTVKLMGLVWFCTVILRLLKAEVLASAAARAPEEAAVEISLLTLAKRSVAEDVPEVSTPADTVNDTSTDVDRSRRRLKVMFTSEALTFLMFLAEM